MKQLYITGSNTHDKRVKEPSLETGYECRGAAATCQIAPLMDWRKTLTHLLYDNVHQSALKIAHSLH